MSKLKLKKELEVDGEKISTIEYDFDSVKPIQYMNIVKKLSKNKSISVPEIDMDVQLAYFSAASGIMVNDLKRLESIRDFNEIISKTRDFLLGSSEEENQELSNFEQ